MSSARNGADNQRLILRMICSCFQRARGLFSCCAKRRNLCNTRLRLVVTLCNCSPAKEAEYFTTQRYSRPCTRIFSPAARTPGWALLHTANSSTARLRNSAGAWFQGRAEIHPNPASSKVSVLASAAAPLSSTSVTVSRNLVFIQHAGDTRQSCRKLFHIGDIAGVDVMTQAQAMLPIQHIAESDLAQVVSTLFIVAALRQLIAHVAAGDIGIEVGGVVRQQPTTHQLFFLPQAQQS